MMVMMNQLDDKSGKHIIDILQKKKDDYTDDDLSHMRKVTAFAIFFFFPHTYRTRNTPAQFNY